MENSGSASDRAKGRELRAAKEKALHEAQAEWQDDEEELLDANGNKVSQEALAEWVTWLFREKGKVRICENETSATRFQILLEACLRADYFISRSHRLTRDRNGFVMQGDLLQHGVTETVLAFLHSLPKRGGAVPYYVQHDMDQSINNEIGEQNARVMGFKIYTFKIMDPKDVLNNELYTVGAH